MNKKISYHELVNYKVADPAKVLAQKQGLATAKNMPFGFKEVSGTRGESAYVFDIGDMYGALVQEGLGTKSLIAQSIYKSTGQSFFAAVAQDTVATVINDLISVGATPVVLSAYWSAGSYEWLEDNKLTEDFIKGWRAACDESGVTWGGGETQSLPGIVEDGALEFAGCGFGVIKPKGELVSEKNLKDGDVILLIESNGVHANGISLTRKIAENLKDGYQTKLADGSTYGEVLLQPTHLYAQLVRSLFKEGLKIHYLSNITGHGWRKLMRATAEFSYVMEEIPPVPEIFNFIATQTGDSDEEMYGNYNMGAGYSVYLSKNDAIKAQKIAKKLGFKSWIAGRVKKGPKRVVIKPKNIVFRGDTLELRG
jgi:phosphoribosylformylglycinamidine cyclo-ligase